MIITSMLAWGIAAAFAWGAILVTAHLIYGHLKNYRKPAHQLWIVRILFMVPIYSFASWMSLRFYHYSLFFDVVRDCYEAFVIYNFLALCFEYLGGEAEVLNCIKGRSFQPSWITGTCCIPSFEYTSSFLRFCKRGTLQFCIVKPVMALCIIAFDLTGLYDDGNLSATNAYPYICLVYNTSITVALYALLMFYEATKEHLRPYGPISKFVVIKSVIFLSFWQSVAIAALQKFGAISDDPSGEVETGELAVMYQNFIICIEMFFAALAHLYAFPYAPYKNLEHTLPSASSFVSNLKQTLNPADMVGEAIRNFSPQYETYVKPPTDEELHDVTARRGVDDDENHADAMAITIFAGKPASKKEAEKVEKETLLEKSLDDE